MSRPSEYYQARPTQYPRSSTNIATRQARDQRMDNQIVKYDNDRLRITYQFPAERWAAQIHRNANKFGFNTLKQKDGKKIKRCPHCQTPNNVKPLDIDTDTQPVIRTQEQYKADKIDKGDKKLKFLLNSGTSMFFAFIKMVFIFLIMRFLIADAFNLFTNLTAKCTGKCDYGFMAKASLFNKKQNARQLIMISDLLDLGLVVISMVFFFFYKKYQFKIYNEIDRRYYTQDDFTLFLENIPIFIPQKYDQEAGENIFEYQQYIKNKLQNHLNEWIDNLRNRPSSNEDNLDRAMLQCIRNTQNFNDRPKVTSVTLCMDLSQIQKIRDLRQETMARYTSSIQKSCLSCLDEDIPEARYFEGTFLQETKQRIQILNRQYEELSKDFSTDDSIDFNVSHFLGKALVSFQQQHYRNFFQRQFRLKDKLIFEGNQIQISRAADPSDIFWYNLSMPENTRTNRVRFSFVIMFIVLITMFGAIVGLQLLKTDLNIRLKNSIGQDYQKDSTYNIVNLIMTSISSGLTVAVDFLLASIIRHLTDSQRQKTSTLDSASLIVKTVIAQFFNTAFIYFVIFSIHSEIDPMSKEGIVTQVISLVTISSAIKLGLNIAQIGDLMRRFKIRNLQKQETAQMFQIQLNRKFQLPNFNFAQRYSQYIVFCLIANFYAYITPIATIIIAVVVLIQYWVDKYNLFRRFSVPVNFTYRLSRLTVKILEASILIIALGNVLFASWVNEEKKLTPINYVTLGIAIIYSAVVIFTPQHIQQKIFEFVETETKTYSECVQKKYFTRNYWRSNPATCYLKEKNLNYKGPGTYSYSAQSTSKQSQYVEYGASYDNPATCYAKEKNLNYKGPGTYSYSAQSTSKQSQYVEYGASYDIAERGDQTQNKQ